MSEQINNLKKWIKGKRVLFVLTSAFSLNMFHIGKEKIDPDYKLNYGELLRFLKSDCEAEFVKGIYFSSYRATSGSQPAAPELKLLEWIEKGAGYEVHRSPPRVAIRGGELRSMLPSFSVGIAYRTAELINDFDVFIILDVVPPTGEINKWLSDRGKVVIGGELSYRPKVVDIAAKGNAHVIIDFSDTELLERVRRTFKPFQSKSSEEIDEVELDNDDEEDDSNTGLKALLNRTGKTAA